MTITCVMTDEQRLIVTFVFLTLYHTIPTFNNPKPF